VTAAPDPRPDGAVSGPAPPPGLDNLRVLTAHCQRCQHKIGEYMGETKIKVGGIIKDRAVVGKCEKCKKRCVVVPLCKMRPHERPNGSDANLSNPT
jgi:hypothetical protein